MRARELEAQVPAIETDDEEDPTDSDDPFAVLEDEANNSVEEEVSGLLEDLADLDFVGMDCVEVAPPYDHAELTSCAAATFVWTYLAGRMAAARLSR